MNKINLANKWALVCGHSSVDKTSNLLSIFNTIEEITINPPNGEDNIPVTGVVVPIQHEFVSIWTRDSSDMKNDSSVEFDFRFIDPSGSVLLEKKGEKMKFEKNKSNLRLFIKLTGLKITTLGVYRYEIAITDSRFKQIGNVTADFEVKLGRKK